MLRKIKQKTTYKNIFYTYKIIRKLGVKIMKININILTYLYEFNINYPHWILIIIL